jgi:hypothetical protein
MPREMQTVPANTVPTNPPSDCRTEPDESVGNFLRHLEQTDLRVRVRRFHPDGKVRVSIVLSVPAGNFDELLSRARCAFS